MMVACNHTLFVYNTKHSEIDFITLNHNGAYTRLQVFIVECISLIYNISIKVTQLKIGSSAYNYVY